MEKRGKMRGGCQRQGEMQQDTLMGKRGEWEARKKKIRKDES